MQSKQIASLITEATALEREIDAKAVRLGTIRALLIHSAEVALKEAGNKALPGNSHTFTDEGGTCALISFPRDKTIGTFWFRGDDAYRRRDDQTVCLGPLKELAGEHFRTLFFPMFKPAKGFADLLPALVKAKSRLAKLLEVCFEPSSPRCSFKTHDATAADRAREAVLIDLPRAAGE